jgi:cytochrome c-type biogenesis protein CcmE
VHPIRKQRLILILSILAAVAIAVGLVLWALRQNMNHYATPQQLAAGQIDVGQRLRIGGLVKTGSVQRSKDSLQVSFVITDLVADITVEYRGILPDLFREGQGVVVTGTYQGDSHLQASEVLAKHDEKYMPPEAYEALKASGKWQPEDQKSP